MSAANATAILRLQGLILPAEHMCPEDADRFLRFVSHMTPNAPPQAPHAEPDRRHQRQRSHEDVPQAHGEHDPAAGIVTCRRSRHLDSANHPQGQGSVHDRGRVQELCHRDCRQVLSKLEFLRILNRAWIATRSNIPGVPARVEATPGVAG
ncbi:hypothetical protein N657DRAFT_147589 [Parathielavia appendiculata]|uniref:Uncharacterized protein n=1 Tax=Parathielavia appendiculata TaxID=2587402 RepID=A0AAN6Z1U5_9PEZI|nr:hypothetical protein N657DRAFT_147589 [Parathielavia appendiculata]